MKTLIAGLMTTLCALGGAAAQDHLRSSEATVQAIEARVADPGRPDSHRDRDRHRRPVETLSFCGLEPDMTVVEIWPGGQGGWYRRIIEPTIEEGEGRYIPVAGRSAFPARVDDLPYGEVDLVLIFRAHGFMIYDQPAQNYLDAIYEMLRPGGVFCIVDHAGDETIPQDPAGANGYVNESHFFGLAKRAGFNIIAASDHNRNPNDGKNHPNGVYSLPPTLKGDKADRSRFQAIGESDRFTHKYYRP